VGHFDAVAIRYALDVCGGADALALTHLDVARARADLRICRAYEIDDQRVERLPVGASGDLDRQARLTRRPLTARPVYGRPLTCGIGRSRRFPSWGRRCARRGGENRCCAGSSSLP
jgi:hypothetical protein